MIHDIRHSIVSARRRWCLVPRDYRATCLVFRFEDARDIVEDIDTRATFKARSFSIASRSKMLLFSRIRLFQSLLDTHIE